MSNENQSVTAVNGQHEMFGTLFKPTDEALRSKTNKAGSTRVGLLPMRSKNGESLAKVLGLTGAALEVARARLQDEMKQRIGGLTGIVSSAPEWTGLGYAVNAKRDRITATWVLRGTPTKEGMKASMTDDEVLELAIARGILDKAPAEIES